MNAWGWTRLPGPDFGVAGETLEYPAHLDLLAASPCAETRTSLERLLAPAGHRLRLVADAQELLSQFQAKPPDLVLLDQPLCVADALALPARLRAITDAQRWVPLLLLADTPPDPGNCLRAGIDDWLPKPVEASQLESRLLLVGKSLALQRRLLDMHRLQTLFDHVLDGIVATDAQGIVESFNPAAERIFGYQAAEVVGRNVSMLMPLPDAHRHDAYMARYRATGEATVMGRGRDIFGKRKDGSLVPISVTLTEMEWLGRRHFVAVIEDISERKRQEQRLANTLAELQGYRERIEEERHVTRELVERMVARAQLDDPLLQWKVIPAETFSGDIILSQRAPDGRLFVFAADAMGRGLPAAVSLLPVAGIFHAMAGKGLDIGLIAREMNRRLRELVPTGHFVAACLVEVNEAQKRLSLWTAGMPRPLLCFAGQPPVPLGGCRLPLGIAADEAEAPQDSCEELAWSEPGWLVIYSDGLSEAGHVHASALGAAALEETIAAAPGNPFPALLARLEQHLAGRPPEDDILLAVIRLP